MESSSSFFTDAIDDRLEFRNLVICRGFREQCFDLCALQQTFLRASLLDDRHRVYRSPEESFFKRLSERECTDDGRSKRVARAGAVIRGIGIRIHRHFQDLRPVIGIRAVRAVGDKGDLWAGFSHRLEDDVHVRPGSKAEKRFRLLLIHDADIGTRIEFLEWLQAPSELSAGLKGECRLRVLAEPRREAGMKSPRRVADGREIHISRRFERPRNDVRSKGVFYQYGALSAEPEDEVMIRRPLGAGGKRRVDAFFFQDGDVRVAVLIGTYIREESCFKAEARRRDGSIGGIPDAGDLHGELIGDLGTPLHADGLVLMIHIGMDMCVFEADEGVGGDIADGEKIEHKESILYFMYMSLAEELRKTVRGAVDDSPAARDAASRDASLFRIEPAVVVKPLDAADVAAVVRLAAEKKKAGESISVTARAAGTDMSGGPLNSSIILDMTGMNRLIELGADYAIVEPGMYFRDFDKETQKKNLELPSYTASREINTVGGMAANNSGGEKNLKYGKTARYVQELDVVLSDGQVHTLKNLEGDALAEKLAEQSFEGDLYRAVATLVRENKQTIADAAPKVEKNSSGYALWDIGDGGKSLNLARLMVGAQGTLGIITKIRYGLVHPEAYSSMVVMFLKDLHDLGILVPEALKHSQTVSNHTMTTRFPSR